MRLGDRGVRIKAQSSSMLIWHGLNYMPPDHSPICNLQITNTVSTPEIAFTGDTTSEFHS